MELTKTFSTIKTWTKTERLKLLIQTDLLQREKWSPVLGQNLFGYENEEPEKDESCRMQTSIWFNQNISEGRPKVYHYFLFFSPNGSHEMIHPANNFTLKFIKPKPSLKISTQHIYSRPTKHLQPTRIEINPLPSIVS